MWLSLAHWFLWFKYVISDLKVETQFLCKDVTDNQW